PLDKSKLPSNPDSPPAKRPPFPSDETNKSGAVPTGSETGFHANPFTEEKAKPLKIPSPPTATNRFPAACQTTPSNAPSGFVPDAGTLQSTPPFVDTAHAIRLELNPTATQ